MQTIGLIGGMSWQSSAEYYRVLNELVREKLGGLHSARCLLYSVDFAEIEQLQTTGAWEEAGHLLAAAGQSLERILRRSHAHRGARVELRGGTTLDVDLWVVMLAGNSVPKVGAEVQQRVADAVQRMLGLEVGNINVHVSEVVFAP